MKRNLIFIIFSLFLIQAQAQQDPIYGLQSGAPMLVNPAYAAMHYHASANLLYRLQWSGFEGAPLTAAFSGHSSLGNQKAGVGLNLIYDQYGVTKNTEINLNYGYKVDVGSSNLIFGIQGGLINISTDYQSLSIRDQDQVFDQDISEMTPNFGAGIIFSTQRLFAGFSIPRILSTNLDAGDLQVNYYERHYYLSLGGLFILSESLDFRPSVLMRISKGLPVNYDIRMDFIMNRMFTGGILTRSFNTYGATVGFTGNDKLRIRYQFELPVGNSPGPRFSTHEIGLGIDFTLFSGQKNYFKYF